jgi:endonuclease/exonuclease/phosphatase (EEP) superfamily protein YafD
MLPVWAAVGVLALAAVLRWVAFDESEFATMANAYALWIYLPAYAFLSAAVCFRARVLGAVSVLLIATQLAIVVPPSTREEAIPAAARTAPKFRIVTANVRYTNPTPAAIARELLDYDADVIIIQELTPRSWRAVRAAGLLDAYPYHVEEVRTDAGGIALLSRLELRDPTIAHSYAWPFVLARVDVGGRSISLIGVHIAGPGFFTRHRRHQERIERLLRNTAPSRVLAGDFNSTPFNAWISQLRDLGLRDAHETRGRAHVTTWPNGEHVLPPVLVDHVVLDDSLVPLRVREGTGRGSDHRPVIVDVAVLPALPPAAPR